MNCPFKLLRSMAAGTKLLLYHLLKRSIFHWLPQTIKTRDKPIDLNMASMSGEPRRVDIWRLISSVPVAYWYIGSDVWRRADLMLFGHSYSKLLCFSMWFDCSVFLR